MFRIVLVSCVFFLELVWNCQAQPVIFVNTEKESINIIHQVAILHDSSGVLSFREVSSEPFENKFYSAPHS